MTIGRKALRNSIVCYANMSRNYRPLKLLPPWDPISTCAPSSLARKAFLQISPFRANAPLIVLFCDCETTGLFVTAVTNSPMGVTLSRRFALHVTADVNS